MPKLTFGSEFNHRVPSITNGTVRKESVARACVYFLHMTKWMPHLKFCSITWGSDIELTRACKSTTALHTERAKSNGKDLHASNRATLSKYFFFPHQLQHTCNVHGKMKTAPNATRRVKLIEPYHNVCCVPFYVVFLRRFYPLKTQRQFVTHPAYRNKQLYKALSTKKYTSHF